MPSTAEASPQAAAQGAGGAGVEDPARYDGADRTPAAERLRFVNYTTALFEEARDLMRPRHIAWMRNLLFLANRQWWTITYDGRFKPERSVSWREYPVSNMVLPHFRNAVANATRNRPRWNIIPASTEPDDMQSAQLADGIAEAKWEELRMSRTHRHAVAWAVVTGSGPMLPDWNADAGKITALTVPMDCPVLDERGEPVPEFNEAGEVVGVMTEELDVPCDDQGRPQLQPNGRPKDVEPAYVDEGEVRARAINPFCLYLDPDAETWEEVGYFIIVERLSERQWRKRYPNLPYSHEDVSWMEWSEGMMGNMVDEWGSRFRNPGHEWGFRLVEKAVVFRYYERPSLDYPKGRYWECSRHDLLAKPQPLPDGIWPGLEMIVEVPVPGSPWGQATMDSLTGLNFARNRTLQKIREWMNLVLNPKVLDPGGRLQPGAITTQPGEVVPVPPDKALHPYYMQLPPVPSETFAELARLDKDFEVISGFRQVTQGGASPGASGKSIALLQEADKTDLEPFLASGEEVIASLVHSILRIVRNRYTTERLVTIAGKDRSFTVRRFKGADLAGVQDVRPVVGSSRPLTETAKVALFMDLMGGPLIEAFKDPETGQLDVQEIQRRFAVGGAEQFQTPASADANEALREQEAFETGDFDGILPQPWQNHEVHAFQHRQILVSAGFTEWPPEAQQAFIAHYLDTVGARDETRLRSKLAGAGVDPKMAAMLQAGGPTDPALMDPNADPAAGMEPPLQ